MYDNGLRCGLIKNLIRKIDYFRRRGLRFSHILEMNITSIPSLNLMTYEHYFMQPIQMIESVLNKKLYQNPELVKRLKDVNLTFFIYGTHTNYPLGRIKYNYSYRKSINGNQT